MDLAGQLIALLSSGTSLQFFLLFLTHISISNPLATSSATHSNPVPAMVGTVDVAVLVLHWLSLDDFLILLVTFEVQFQSLPNSFPCLLFGMV